MERRHRCNYAKHIHENSMTYYKQIKTPIIELNRFNKGTYYHKKNLLFGKQKYTTKKQKQTNKSPTTIITTPNKQTKTN